MTAMRAVLDVVADDLWAKGHAQGYSDGYSDADAGG